MAKIDRQKEKNSNSPGGFGGFTFTKFFEGLEKLIDLAEKVKNTGEVSQQREFTLPAGPKGREIKGVYGFTVRTLASGQQHVEHFGNIKKTPRGPMVAEAREPIVDVFDEKDHIRVVAEVPGVSEEHVQFEVHGDVLKLSATHGDRKYSKEVLLPCMVQDKAESVFFKNGIFELNFLKKSIRLKDQK